MSDKNSVVAEPVAEPKKPCRIGFKAAPPPDRITMTIDGVRIASGLGLSTIRDLVAAGTLRSRMVAGRRLIFVNSLLELLNGSPGE